MADAEPLGPASGLPQVCVCYLTRVDASGVTRVLLGRKKGGLGAGKLVGLGGKLEPGESVLDAAVREVHEESGVRVRARDLVPLARLRYFFPDRPAWSQESTAFRCDSFEGEPVESDELVPEWFELEHLPFERMWHDARFWLPLALAGDQIRASFTFGSDLDTVVSSDLPGVTLA
ncbi:8-oxo-dGTP diphosphatase [Compostimonas suwonensis]|uniref:Oxidized purine nucleoside triphosphate hydrolase n=1 Tax=Compostimonas suwonensis TaxID=1048394 RepID=A0A2M9BTZ1_9MICO|nr:8-oxo-dGTP diphosphatase [Compostimonas suwonensis]PJJ61416.1 8-oxo-dGTP diphosphatase [Compostimonas suwonensis]